MSVSAFRRRSREQAARFLQTAVVVDDQARLDIEEEQEPVPETVVEPTRGGPVQPTVPAAPHRREQNDLDAKRLVDTFAAEGVVCAVLKPVFGDGEDYAEVEHRTDKATQRADIVIMDWNLLGTKEAPGEQAKKLIQKIIATDVETGTAPRRLRLVAVYTQEADLLGIAAQLRKLAAGLGLVVEQRESETEETKSPKPEDYVVRAGPVTMVVYGKVGVTIQDGAEDLDRRVSEDKLPDRLVDDFTDMTEGLLSNVTLASLSAVRNNTHRILSRFSHQIDAPYVAHRAMLIQPGEAEDHPVPLVTAEIEGVLADDQTVPELVGHEALREWLETVKGAPMGEGLRMDADRFRQAILALATDGPEKHIPAPFGDQWISLVNALVKKKKTALSRLTNEMTSEDSDGEKADQEFAVLTAIRSQYDEPRPVLRLGTVVAVGDEYRLCMQPVCDSVRLPEGVARSFPMLELKVVPDNATSPTIDLVVRGGSSTTPATGLSYVRLAVSLKPHKLTLLSIEPTPGRGTVTASEADADGNQWFTEPKDEASGIRWVADLKPEFAHRIANRFGAEISRVGLTESEWLRRMAS